MNGKRPNELLDRLPPSEAAHVTRIARPRAFAARAHVRDARHSLLELLFPVDGAVAVLAGTDDGDMVALGMIGRDGALGTERMLGVPPMTWQELSVVPTEAIALPRAMISCGELPVLRARLLDFSGRLLREFAQAVVCQRFHAASGRSALQLLRLTDTTGELSLPITHDMLGDMVGVRRPHISVILGELDAARMIMLGRRRIEIRDRAALERAACACYAVGLASGAALDRSEESGPRSAAVRITG